MEFMNLLGSQGFRLWFAQFLVLLFLTGGLAILVIGLSLVFNSAATLRFFAGMNRWVSTRRATRPLEVAHDTGPVAQKYRHLIAAIFIAGGAFALYGLLTQFDARTVIFGLRLNFLKPSFAHWAIDSVRWVLIVGNLAAIVVGIMLAFFPAALIALEARGSRWYSERQIARNRDAMHLTLDTWVARFPRASGCIIAFFAVILIGAFGLMLPAVMR